MASIEMIKVLSGEELTAITAETVTEDTATASHLRRLDYLIKALKAEREQIAAALLEKWEHKKPDSKLFKVQIYDYMKFSEKEFKEKYGDKAYEELKTLLVHVEKVTV